MPDGFDYMAAKRSGATDDDIRSFLKSKYNFDFDFHAARKYYSDDDLAKFFSTKELIPASVTTTPKDTTPDIVTAKDLYSKANQSIPTSISGTTGIATTDDQAIADQKKAKSDYENQIKKISSDWGMSPDVTKQVINDFETNSPDDLKRYASLLKENPTLYYRFKDANDIRMGMVHSQAADAIKQYYDLSPTGLANLFNAKQHADSHQQVLDNIREQQQMINTATLGDGATREALQSKLESSQSPLINPTSEGFTEKKWTTADKDLGLSDYQYAGLETLRVFNPGKAKEYEDILKQDKEAAPSDKKSYTYKKGVENVLYDLENQGRSNTELYLQSVQPELVKQTEQLADQYKQKIAAASTKEEQNALINQFNNEPLVQKVSRNEEEIDKLKYAASEDQWKFPLNTLDRAHQVVQEAIDNKNGFWDNTGKVFKTIGLSMGETVDNTMRFIKNTAINLVGSDQQKAFNAAKNIGNQSLLERVKSEPSSYSGIEPDFNIPKGMVDNVQAIFNNNTLSSEKKASMAERYVRDHLDDLTVNENSGKQNYTGKSILFYSASAVGQILGIAAQSYLMGGGGLASSTSNAGKLASAFVPMFTTTQNALYEQAQAEGKSNPGFRSTVDAAIISLASLINPDINVVKKMFGANTQIGKLIAGVDENTWSQVLEKNKPLYDRMNGFLKGTGKQLGLANLQYGLLAPTAQYLSNKSLYNENPNLTDQIRQNVINTNIQMLVPALTHGVWGGIHATEINPAQKYALVEAALNPERTIESIDQSIASGSLDKPTADQMKDLINKSHDVLMKTETTRQDGSSLSEKQTADLLYHTIRKTALEEKMKNAPESQKAFVQQKIDNVNSKIETLYKNKPIKDANAMIFYSPNEKEDLSFEQAQNNLQTPQQRLFRRYTDRIDNDLGLSSSNQNAIGDWVDGAENSVLSEIGGVKDFDKLKYSAALKALIGNQKAVIPFMADKSGRDAVYIFDTDYPIDEARKKLDEHGIQFRTLVPTSDGTKIILFDKDGENGESIHNFADDYGKKFKYIKGKGEFFGADTREDAAKLFGNFVKQYEEERPNEAPLSRRYNRSVYREGLANLPAEEDQRIKTATTLSENPNSDRIQPTPLLRPLNVGDFKGAENNVENSVRIKEQIRDNEPIGSSGETFSRFQHRILSYLDSIKDSTGKIAVVAHSSVLKAIDIWNKMGRPSEFSTDQAQAFKEKFARSLDKDEIKPIRIKTEKGDVTFIPTGESEGNGFKKDEAKLTINGDQHAKEMGDKIGSVNRIETSDLPRAMRSANQMDEAITKQEQVKSTKPQVDLEFMDNRKLNKTVSMEATVKETGQKVKVKVNALKRQNEIKASLDMLKKIINCVG